MGYKGWFNFYNIFFIIWFVIIIFLSLIGRAFLKIPTGYGLALLVAFGMLWCLKQMYIVTKDGEKQMDAFDTSSGGAKALRKEGEE